MSREPREQTRRIEEMLRQIQLKWEGKHYPRGSATAELNYVLLQRLDEAEAEIEARGPVAVTERAKSGWVKCSERMPRIFEHVVFFDPCESQAIGHWNGKGWVPVGRAEGDSPGLEWWSPVAVTHWMPLPEPPAEVK